MEIRTGTCMNAGIAIGRIKYIRCQETLETSDSALDAAEEIGRYETAQKRVINRIQEMMQKPNLSREAADLLTAQQVLLLDEGYQEQVREHIRFRQLRAEAAVSQTGKQFEDVFENMKDPYIKERAQDIRDITSLLLAALTKGEKCSSAEEASYDQAVILMAEELLPSQVIRFEQDKILGFLTQKGSSLSHTAILARAMHVPYIAHMKIEEKWDGKTVILDGERGNVYFDPDDVTCEFYQKRIEQKSQEKGSYLNLKDEASVTKSGRKIQLFANINGEKDLKRVLQSGAEGIGLFRSEYLYLESGILPTEEEQFQVYKKVLEAMGEKRVIIRTFDFGADKLGESGNLPGMEGVDAEYAVGMTRGIAYTLQHPEILRCQLRALYRASAFGKLSIIHPLVSALDQIEKVGSISEGVKRELLSKGIAIGQVKEGIMIETPEAAALSEVFAQKVDFFSIGTNDLQRFRKQSDICEIMKLVQKITENAHNAGISVEICGELAADSSLTEPFLDMGVEALSMSPEYILPIRKGIREMI